MKVNNYPVKTPEAGDKLFGSNSSGDQYQFNMTNVSNNVQAYSNVASTLIGASAQSTWDGLSNSNAIVAQSGFTSGAAKTCLDLTSFGKNDWYLPSMDELNLIWINRFNINKTLVDVSGSTQVQTNVNYWSSTENTSVNAYGFTIQNAIYMNSFGKSATNYVRAVRKFSI